MNNATLQQQHRDKEYMILVCSLTVSLAASESELFLKLFVRPFK
jgi:hypothetical protein